MAHSSLPADTLAAPKSPSRLFAPGVIAASMLAQFGWLSFALEPRLALVNLLPALVFISAWTLFVCHTHAGRPWLRNLLLLPPLILNLRLPVTLHPDLQVVNWLLYLVMAAAVLRQVLALFAGGRERWLLLLTTLVLVVNAAGHLGLDSPYTYTFRLMNALPSGYAGVDNNETWECAYERPQYAVHCDARHFVASEKVFTEPGFDPGFSVVLQRFLHGYLNSLAGLEGTRWWVNLSINFLFWFLACVCIYRICLQLKQSPQVAGLAMLCCASGIGFIDMLAQPSPYLLAYACGPIALWATIEIIHSKLEREQVALYILLIASVVMVYDAFQLILVSALLLFLQRRRMAAVLVFALALLLTVAWRAFSMKVALGTQGDIAGHGSTVALLAQDVRLWNAVLRTQDWSMAFDMLLIGARTYLYGNLVLPAMAAWLVIVRWRPAADSSAASESKSFLIMLAATNALMLAAMIFVVPQMIELSPSTNMQPRLAFYSYPVNMIALMLLAVALLKRFAWIVPLILFALVNINHSGLVSLDMFFDYGRVGIYWK